MTIPCPHFAISIRSRNGSSAVAGSAYLSAENLFSEYDQSRKYYSKKKNEVYYKKVMLPINAPAEYLNREILWNSAERIEKSYNSQLARNIVAALPNEIPKDQLPKMVTEFCQKQFVDKGMCCDFAIHDKGDGNPHVHILLSLRAIDENGKWLPKCKKVYDLDDNGEKIKLPSGEWKSHKENTTDWNDKDKCELWRSEWANIQNKYYELNNEKIHIDLRSYERQGIDMLPTYHLGPYASMIEEKGGQTDLGNINRIIAEHNRIKTELSNMLTNLIEWVKSLYEKLSRLKEESERKPELIDYFTDYLTLRRRGKSEFGLSLRSTSKYSISSLDRIEKAIKFLNRLEIRTTDDLKAEIQVINKVKETKEKILSIEADIKNIQDFQKYKAIYNKSFPPKGKPHGLIEENIYKKYRANHKDEIDAFLSSYKYLKNKGIPSTTNISELEGKRTMLQIDLKAYDDLYLRETESVIYSFKNIQIDLDHILEDLCLKNPVTNNLKKDRDVDLNISHDKPSLLGDLEKYKNQIERSEKRKSPTRKNELEL